jgi:hypothetical protein
MRDSAAVGEGERFENRLTNVLVKRVPSLEMIEATVGERTAIHPLQDKKPVSRLLVRPPVDQFDDRRVSQLLQGADVPVEELVQEPRLWLVLPKELDRHVAKALLEVARLVDRGRTALQRFTGERES